MLGGSCGTPPQQKERLSCLRPISCSNSRQQQTTEMATSCLDLHRRTLHPTMSKPSGGCSRPKLKPLSQRLVGKLPLPEKGGRVEQPASPAAPAGRKHCAQQRCACVLPALQAARAQENRGYAGEEPTDYRRALPYAARRRACIPQRPLAWPARSGVEALPCPRLLQFPTAFHGQRSRRYPCITDKPPPASPRPSSPSTAQRRSRRQPWSAARPARSPRGPVWRLHRQTKVHSCQGCSAPQLGSWALVNTLPASSNPSWHPPGSARQHLPIPTSPPNPTLTTCLPSPPLPCAGRTSLSYGSADQPLPGAMGEGTLEGPGSGGASRQDWWTAGLEGEQSGGEEEGAAHRRDTQPGQGGANAPPAPRA